MERRILRVVLTAAAVAAATVGVAEPASANHVTCGSVITTSTTLDSNVGPCPAGGITISGDNVVLNLDGYRVFGTAAKGDGVGIRINNRTGVIVKNGEISNFDGGVEILLGGSNKLVGLNVHDNVSDGAGSVGDGILITTSSNNEILTNTVRSNGPFGGITSLGASSGNLIQGNSVLNNIACRVSGTCDNIGIRIENGGTATTIVGNEVRGNGLDGISLFAQTTQNIVRANTVISNGYRGSVAGDGIRVFGSDNTVQRNESRNNKRDGVSVGKRSILGAGALPNGNGLNNDILSNTAQGNGFLDLWDSNPNCDNNTWTGNEFTKAQPACTTG